MKIFKSFTLIILIGIATVGLTVTTAHSSPITYQVNRTIGAGTVIGFIETDGFIGNLVSSNITNWVLTLTAPNLNDGPSDVIDFATASKSQITGAPIEATSTGLFYNFALGGDFFILQDGDNDNFWCLIGGIKVCGTVVGPAEAMGFDDNGPDGFTAAQANTGQTGILQFATVAVIPLPAALPLFLTGLAGLALIRRRRRQA